MGVSRSFPELGGKLRASADHLRAAERPAVTAGGNVARRTFLGAAQAMGATGPRGATVKATSTTSGSHPAVLVRYGPNPGWIAIMEGRVGPHFIGPTGRGRGGLLRRQNTMRGSRRATAMAVASLFGGTVGRGTHKAIGIPGVGPRAWAMHPGIHKKKPFVAVAQTTAPPLAVREMRKVTVTEFARSFAA